MRNMIIIGGGIAGLSAGIFARKNGFSCTIVEKNPVLGGECVGWNRRGYHIDGCIHWLMGTTEGTELNELWRTVGALDGVDIYHPETFISLEYEGIQIHLYRDLEKLSSSWKEISPVDSDAIDEFCNDIRVLQNFEIPAGKPMDMMSLIEKIRYFMSMKEAGFIMKKYGKITLAEYVERFTHPALRSVLSSLALLPDGFSAAFVFFALAAFTKGSASVPRGGSMEFSQRMVKRYLELGGRIETSCEVSELEIDSSRVKRVICSNGKTFDPDYVVAACDAKVFYDRLLKGSYNDRQFENRFSNPADYPLASQVLVSIGYAGTLKDLPRSVSISCKSFTVGTQQVNRILMNHFSHEPGFAPKGHTVITCVVNQLHGDYDYWNNLAKDDRAYKQEKQRIGDDAVSALEERFSEMKGKLTVIDMATPKTYERYCNAYRGAFMSFLPSIRGKSMDHRGAVKGLKNTFLTGQWLQPPGGLPVAVTTGKFTIMRICRKERVPFKE